MPQQGSYAFILNFSEIHVLYEENKADQAALLPEHCLPSTRVLV